MSASPSRPARSPSLLLGTVTILSTISRDGTRRPLAAFGVMSSRNSGASVSSEVKTQMVIEAVASKLSSCSSTAGRGLPA